METNEWATLASRVAWVIKSGRVKTALGWSEKAGLSRSYVNNIKNGKNPKPTLDTIERMAKTADVDREWLLTGRGTPIKHVMDPTEAYPSLAPIVALARAEGVSDGAVSALLAEKHVDGDPGEEYWKKRLIEQIRMVQVVRRAVRDDGTSTLES